MRKTLLLLSLLLLCLGWLSANGDAESSAGKNGALVNPKGTFPIVDEPVSLSLFTNVGDEIYANGMTEWYQEKTNVNIEWIRVPRSSYVEKLKIKMNTQDLPDIIRMEGFSGGESYKFIEDGFFYPISDLYGQYSEYTEEWQKEEPLMFKPTVGSDGKTYGWPYRLTSGGDQFRDNLFIERNWLDAVGMKVPTTTEELYDVLKAFKTQDANGNGDPSDEIPFSTCNLRPVYSGPFISAFMTSPSDKSLFLGVQNGKVYISRATEEYRDALRYLNKLWKEGLIYPESFTQDRGTQWKLNEQFPDYNMIGVFQGMHFNYAMNWESDRWMDYAEVPILKGPQGVQVAAWRSPELTSRLNTVISAETAYPEVAFRWIDWLQGEEGSLTMEVGLKGVHYRDAQPGETNNRGSKAVYTEITNNEETPFAWGELVVEHWGGNRFDELMAAAVDKRNQDGLGKSQILEKHAIDSMTYAPALDTLWPENLPISPDMAAEYGVLNTNLTDLINEHATEFVVGTKDIEKDWDTYLKELDNAGADRFLDMSQELYDTYY